MVGYIKFADDLSAWFGKVFAWCILVMTFGIGYEVVVRYAFRAPTPWAFVLLTTVARLRCVLLNRCARRRHGAKCKP